MNRQPLMESGFFSMRKNAVKWPTLRKAWLTNDNVSMLQKYVTGKGRSIVFLDGVYETKLNRYVNKPSTERAIFFEFMAKHPTAKGAIFALSWIGNFHNGCIFHCAWQYPQVNCWKKCDPNAENFLEEASFNLYHDIANIVYDTANGGNIIDDEVREFINNGKRNSKETERVILTNTYQIT